MGYTCCSPGYRGAVCVVRRYPSRAERLAWLATYADELENELTGVRERIADLEAEEE